MTEQSEQELYSENNYNDVKAIVERYLSRPDRYRATLGDLVEFIQNGKSNSEDLLAGKVRQLNLSAETRYTIINRLIREGLIQCDEIAVWRTGIQVGLRTRD